jgi:hypothetical protein
MSTTASQAEVSRLLVEAFPACSIFFFVFLARRDDASLVPASSLGCNVPGPPETRRIIRCGQEGEKEEKKKKKKEKKKKKKKKKKKRTKAKKTHT